MRMALRLMLVTFAVGTLGSCGASRDAKRELKRYLHDKMKLTRCGETYFVENRFRQFNGGYEKILEFQGIEIGVKEVSPLHADGSKSLEFYGKGSLGAKAGRMTYRDLGPNGDPPTCWPPWDNEHGIDFEVSKVSGKWSVKPLNYDDPNNYVAIDCQDVQGIQTCEDLKAAAR